MADKRKRNKPVAKRSTKKQQTDESKHWRRLRGFARRWRQWNLKRRVVFVCAMILTTMIVLFVMFVALMAAAFTGFPYSAISSIDPESPHIVAAEAKAISDIIGDMTSVTTGTNLKFYTKSQVSGCFRGANGFLASDGFASRCSLYIAYHYGMGSDYKDQLQKLVKNLQYNQWTMSHDGEQTLEEGLDSLTEEPPTTNYTPSISTGTYVKDPHALSVQVLSRADKYGEAQTLNHDGKKIFADIAKENDFVVTISISDIYASKPSLRDGLF